MMAVLKNISELTGVKFLFIRNCEIKDIVLCSTQDLTEIAIHDQLAVNMPTDYPLITGVLSLAVIGKCCLNALLSELKNSSQFSAKETIIYCQKELERLSRLYESSFLINKTIPSYDKCQMAFKRVKFPIARCKLSISEVKINDSNIMCEILGLDEDVYGHMFKFDDEEFEHQTHVYYIHDFMDDRWRKIKKNPQFKNSELNLESQLTQLGFTTDRAKFLVSSLDGQLAHAESALYWAKNYQDQLFACHPLLNTATKKAEEDYFLNQKVLLLEKSESHNLTLLEQKNCTLLFHGTTEESMYSILDGGINLRMGEGKQDFSHKDGFSLFDSYKAASQWSKLKSHGLKSVVLVFRVENELLDCQNYNGLDLSENLDKWQKVVRYFRSGSWKDIDSNVKNEIRKSTFIKGPMLINFHEYFRQNRKPSFLSNNNLYVQQFCFRERKFAEELSDKICAAYISD